MHLINKTIKPAKLFAILNLSLLLCSCGSPKEVSFKSAGVTQTFTPGSSAVSITFEKFIYPGATTSGSVSAEGENSEESQFLMLTSKDPIEKVSKWYQEKFKAENWKITGQQEQTKLISITGTKENTELSAMLTEDNGHTSISLSMDKQTNSNDFGDENNKENFVPNKETPPTD